MDSKDPINNKTGNKDPTMANNPITNGDNNQIINGDNNHSKVDGDNSNHHNKVDGDNNNHNSKVDGDNRTRVRIPTINDMR